MSLLPCGLLSFVRVDLGTHQGEARFAWDRFATIDSVFIADASFGSTWTLHG